MARPKKEIDEKQVATLAKIGCTYAEIAAVVECDASTLTRRFAQVIKSGHEARNASVRRAQYDVGVNKKNPTMLIWLGKQHLGQRERQSIDLNTLTPEQALAILAADSGTERGGNA